MVATIASCVVGAFGAAIALTFCCKSGETDTLTRCIDSLFEVKLDKPSLRHPYPKELADNEVH